MKTIQDIKAEKEQKTTDLIKAVSMFFAFSTEQFHANKTPLKEGEKYVSIGAGAYLPKGNLQAFENGVDEIEKWYKAEVKSNKARKQNIAYELNNHEAFYTGSIDDTLDALGADYTRDEVMEVYRAERKKQTANY